MLNGEEVPVVVAEAWPAATRVERGELVEAERDLPEVGQVASWLLQPERPASVLAESDVPPTDRPVVRVSLGDLLAQLAEQERSLSDLSVQLAEQERLLAQREQLLVGAVRLREEIRERLAQEDWR